MLEESVEIMRMLWSGGVHSFDGQHYVVDRARLYSLPDEPVPVYMSGFGPKAVAVAGRIGEGHVNVTPDPERLTAYREAGGEGPAQGGMKICWGADEDECVKTVHRLWPNEALGGELAQVLPMPAHYEAACEPITDEMLAEAVTCGPDPEKHAAKIQEFLDAGYDEVYVNQIGDDQEGFLKFMKEEILPRFS
jgi:G6PDH family F420-dependent oxidoreductase